MCIQVVALCLFLVTLEVYRGLLSHVNSYAYSKRVKRSSGSCESDENWARHRNSLAAEDMLNVGVGHLISDSQKATPWDENHPDFISLHKDSTHLTPEKMEKRVSLTTLTSACL